MNGFDILLAATLLVFTAIGVWRGFVREIMTLVTWALGVLLAWIFADDLAGLFERLTEERALRQVLAFVLIFAVVFVAGTVAALFINKFLLAQQSFRLPNMIMGGAVGALRGVVVVVIVFLVAGLTALPQRSWWREAALAPYFERAAVFASGYIPRDIARHIRYG